MEQTSFTKRVLFLLLIRPLEDSHHQWGSLAPDCDMHISKTAKSFLLGGGVETCTISATIFLVDLN